MAYSDYGGYAYRDGVRVPERSDCVLSPEGIKSTPGAWPGWTLPEGRGGHSFHVVLGDGDVMLALYKQSTFQLYRRGEQLEEIRLLAPGQCVKIRTYEGGVRIDTEDLINDDPLVFVVDGHTITIWLTEEDNYYIYAKLEQPDGVVWTGWSGYGVGAGLEDAGYGFSSKARDETLARLLEE
jgi:hypothetical protein